MPTVNAGKYGYMDNTSTISFSNLRSETTSFPFNPANQPSQSNAQAVLRGFSTGGKGSEWKLRRSWWAFDVSTYASDTITNLRLYYDPTTSTTTNFPIAIVKSTAQGDADENLVKEDWNNLDFNTLYGGGSNIYWNDSNSLSYFDLNANAVSAFETSYLKVCVIWYQDYTNTTPSTTGFQNGYQNFGTIPYLSFTAVAPGYGNNVAGVLNQNISRIIGLPKTNIATVTGI